MMVGPAVVGGRRECTPVGLMKRSYFGGFRVKPAPTKVGFVTMRFHCFFCRLPDRMTLNISSSAIGRTCCNVKELSVIEHS